MPTPKQNPAQAALRSNAPGAGIPIRSAVCAAAFGIGLGIVQVATMTVSISVGVSPASLTARAPGVAGHVDQQRVLLGDAPALDADPLADPLVVGVHALRRGRRW